MRNVFWAILAAFSGLFIYLLVSWLPRHALAQLGSDGQYHLAAEGGKMILSSWPLLLSIAGMLAALIVIGLALVYEAAAKIDQNHMRERYDREIKEYQQMATTAHQRAQLAQSEANAAAQAEMTQQHQALKEARQAAETARQEALQVTAAAHERIEKYKADAHTANEKKTQAMAFAERMKRRAKRS